MESPYIIVKYFSGTLSTFSVQNQHDDKTSENGTRFGGAERGVVAKFSNRLFVHVEFHMRIHVMNKIIRVRSSYVYRRLDIVAT